MKNLLTVKLRRDLRTSWSRFALMTIAIAISLTAFGGILSAWTAGGRETERAYLSTDPASATILLDKAVDADRMTTIAAEAKSRPGVLEASGRTQFDTTVEVNGKSRDIPLQVFVTAPDDPMRVATFEPVRGSWPAAADEIFLSRDSLALLDVAVGDVLTVEAPGGESVRLRVADTVYDPSLAPAPQEQRGHAYLSTAAIAAAGTPATLDQLKLRLAEPGQAAPSRDRDAVVTIAGNVAEWVQQEYGVAIREIQVPKPYAHPHQWQADALLGSLLAGGAAALLLSTILVANMLNNLFTQQIPQIGIMKAIGAGSRRIGRVYLAMVLIVAAVATAIALVPALWLGRTAVTRFLTMLGIEPVSLAPAWWTYAVIVAVGLGLPVVMALIPLVNASRITVRAAIDHHGGGSKPSSAAGALARLSRLRRLDRGLLMALRNTMRRPARFFLAVGLLASAGTVFVAGMSLSTGTDAIAQEQKAQRNWDVDVQLAIPAAMAGVAAAVESLPNITSIEGMYIAPTGIAGPGRIPVTRTYPDQGHGRISVTAIPDDSTRFTTPELLEGRWLNDGETGAVVLNQITRDNSVPGVGARDTVQLIIDGKSTRWRVVGIVAEREGGASGVYTTAAGFGAAMGQPPRVNQLRIATAGHDEETRRTAAAAAEEALVAAGIAVRSADSVSRSDAVSAGHLGPVIIVLLGVALPLGVIGVIGLASTMSANILDRTREFGIMHAIGALPKAVRRIVVAEGIFLALTSCLVAAIPALVLTKLLGIGFGNLFMSAPLPYRISLFAVGIWLVVVILGATLATDAAATRASRMTVREALSYL